MSAAKISTNPDDAWDDNWDRTDVNIQFPPGIGYASMEKLGGDLKAHFAFGTPEEQEARLEEARVEQEAMAGYALVVSSVRQTHYVDDKQQDIYEVWATFAPATKAPPKDATQV